jgi:pimeloyl-ACP methyl ester carboxylesterase
VIQSAAPSRSAGRAGAPALWFIHALGDSSLAFRELLTSRLGSFFELVAPDWPGAGAAAERADVADLDGLAAWLAAAIERHSPGRRIGLVGHSLGAAVAVRAASRLGSVVGVFSIEGNLTPEDAYFSGLAAAFENAEEYREHVLARVGALARAASSGRSEPLWGFARSLAVTPAELLWRVGRCAAAASLGNGLGEEYRRLGIPRLYYWSRENTPPQTRDYVEAHGLRNVEFSGGHWPMLERPEETARQIAAFFRPLVSVRRSAKPGVWDGTGGRQPSS